MPTGGDRILNWLLSQQLREAIPAMPRESPALRARRVHTPPPLRARCAHSPQSQMCTHSPQCQMCPHQPSEPDVHIPLTDRCAHTSPQCQMCTHPRARFAHTNPQCKCVPTRLSARCAYPPVPDVLTPAPRARCAHTPRASCAHTRPPKPTAPSSLGNLWLQ